MKTILNESYDTLVRTYGFEYLAAREHWPPDWTRSDILDYFDNQQKEKRNERTKEQR